MQEVSSSERIVIDVTNNKIFHIEIENGIVKQPMNNIDIENLSNDEQIIINATIGLIKDKKESNSI